MLEFLMCEMRKHMDAGTYESMLLKWGDSSSSTEKMQQWVKMVRETIGNVAYEGIKRDFRDMEEKKKERNGGMHCMQSFDKSPTVHFRTDIGAELTINQCLADFKMGFSHVLCLLVDPQLDPSICMGT